MSTLTRPRRALVPFLPRPGRKALEDRDDFVVRLDFSSDLPSWHSITVLVQADVSTINLAPGKSVTLKIKADDDADGSIALTWPAWIVLRAALPSSLDAGKTLVVSVVSDGDTDEECVAAWQVEP